MKELISENVVIVAKNLNPSLFSQLWLVKQGIVGEEDFAPNCVFSPFITQIFTDDFQLFVAPEQMQFTLKEKSKDNSELAKEKVGIIIKSIPHTPFKAIGTNFHWKVIPDQSIDFVDFMNNLFVKKGVPIYDQFSENDARFGAYLSKDIFGSRLRLDIKPVRPVGKENLEKKDESLQLAFNYNLDLSDNSDMVDIMLKFLEQWNRMKNYSEDLASIVLGNF
ncbi:MAG: hypothetical protein AAB116_12435 [Candidatus Poribacteria bacterium]